MKRRLLSISLALALCLTLLPTAAWAAGESGGGDTDPGGDAGELENTRVFTWGALISAINGNYSTIILSGDKQEITRGDGEELKISGEKELTIDLNGHSLNTSGTRITVSSGAKLTIENGSSESQTSTITGGIQVEADGTLIITQGEASDGATEPGVTITGNTAPDGGGIYAAGTVTIGGNAKITGNTADNPDVGQGQGYGGGIYVAGGGNVTIQGNAEISDNEAYNRGGGIYVAEGGKVTIGGNAQITGNTFSEVGGNGGGVYNEGGEVIIQGKAQISRNIAPAAAAASTSPAAQ